MKEIILCTISYHYSKQKENKITELENVKAAVESKYFNQTIFRQVLIK